LKPFGYDKKNYEKSQQFFWEENNLEFEPKEKRFTNF
jgi:hypothetical protein